jgi:hypothetical protein
LLCFGKGSTQGVGLDLLAKGIRLEGKEHPDCKRHGNFETRAQTWF